MESLVERLLLRVFPPTSPLHSSPPASPPASLPPAGSAAATILFTTPRTGSSNALAAAAGALLLHGTWGA